MGLSVHIFFGYFKIILTLYCIYNFNSTLYYYLPTATQIKLQRIGIFYWKLLD